MDNDAGYESVKRSSVFDECMVAAKIVKESRSVFATKRDWRGEHKNPGLGN
jgi:hypothetical protein